MTDLELRLTDLLARKADEVNVRPVDGFAEAPYMTASAFTDLSPTETLDLTAIGLQPISALPAANRNRRRGTALLAAAATVAAIALVATRDGDDATPADELIVQPLDPPIDCGLEQCPWSPELTAQALALPIPCDVSTGYCRTLAVSPDGTLVALDPKAGTLTWYDDEPRVVSLTPGLLGNVGDGELVAIGPHDIAYLASRQVEQIFAVAPSGEEITRVAWKRWVGVPAYRKATGLVENGITWLVPNGAPTMPWVDLDGNPITDTRPYPTGKVTDAGIDVRLGEREWLLTEEAGTSLVPLDFLARSDGGVVLVLDTSEMGAETSNLLELSPDGSIGRYFVGRPPVVMPDGSLLVQHNFQLVRLTPPGLDTVGALATNPLELGQGNQTNAQSPSNTAVATVAPTTVAPRRETGAFEGGPSATYAVPDGWENMGYGVSQKRDRMIRADLVGAGDNFYTNCPSGPFNSPVGPTVDDLVSAWANLPGVDATAAMDVTIDGFHGKQFEFTVRDYNERDCNGMYYRCSHTNGAPRPSRCDSVLQNMYGSSQALPNQHHEIWILDADGTRLMILARSFLDSSQRDRAALDEIVASIQIAPTPATRNVSWTFNGETEIPLTFAVPDGWAANDWPGVFKKNAAPNFGVLFDNVANIYTDSCESVLVDPPVGSTVDDLASAWANLPGFNATAVRDIIVDGFNGKHVEFTVPDYDPADCAYGTFKLLNAVGGGDYGAQGPNQHHELMILDVNGNRVVIVATYFPDTSPKDRAAIDEILASIQIG